MSAFLFQNCGNKNLTTGAELYSVENSSLSIDEAKTSLSSNRICPAIMCAAPPQGCHYEPENSTDLPNRCPNSCGKLVCEKPPVVCPMIACAAPPQGCRYNNKPPQNSDGCLAGCGDIICDERPILPIEPPVSCPQIKCAMPPENCEYAGNPPVDRNGCTIGCGDLVCKPITQDPLPPTPIPSHTCQRVPPAGCYFKPHEVQCTNQGCSISMEPCGTLVCIKPPDPVLPIRPLKPIACPMIDYVCPLPSPECRYDNQKQIDSRGCPVGCGNLICEEGAEL